MARRLKSTFLSFSRFAAPPLAAMLCLGASGQLAPSPVLSILPIAQKNRVAASPNLSVKQQLPGHLPRWVNAQREVANRAVDQNSAMQLMITLQRDPAVQAAFDQLLADQQNPGSPLYQHWLTPAEIGRIYGPTESDVDSLVSWLTTQGLTVTSVVPSRMLIHASGSVSTVSNAFQTSFAYYTTGGNERLANRTEPVVPQALSPIIAAISGLAQMFSESQVHAEPVRNPERYQKGVPNDPGPMVTYSPTEYHLSAGDFDTIYDIDSVIDGGNTGATIGSTTNAQCPVPTAQCVAIIGRDTLLAGDVTKYMANFGAHGQTTYHLTQIQVPAASGGVPGGAPEGNVEGELDVQRVVGTANGAQAVYVYSENGSSDGVTIAASYNVNTLVYPVMTLSFALCEAKASDSQKTTVGTLFSQAAAEGITTLFASGDAAAAGCDGVGVAPPATTQIRSPSYFCASPYVTCVGGTEFADAASYSTYWNPTNDAGGKSVKSYIPEGAWNDPGSPGSYIVAGTGGGVSTYVQKPSFQTGIGVPADGYRDTPDISFSGADHDAYVGYATLTAGAQPALLNIGGTSASAPGMAGIVALLNTRLGRAVGNLNPLIYHLAATSPSSFHDVTVASSGVGTCDAGTPSMCNNSTAFSASQLTGGLTGYTVHAGYDLATGWGSLDVANFLSAAAALDAGVNLSIASTHTGSFKPGDTGDTYTLTVGNAGATTSSGTITVVDTLPGGFTATAIGGTGWTCTLATLTCTTTAAIPTKTNANAITLTVNVSGADVGLYTNYASITGGGATGTLSTVDTTNVVAPPVLMVSLSPASIAPGGTSTWTYTFSNPAANPVRLTNIVFKNQLPAGFTENQPYGFSCTGGTGGFGYGTADFIAGGSLDPGGSCTFKVDVTATSAPVGTYVDTTTTITSDQANPGPGATATLTVQIPPKVFVFLSSGSAVSFLNDGTPQSGATSGGGIGAAVDAGGNVWSVVAGGGGVSKFTSAGALLGNGTAANLTSGTALAIDGKGVVWITQGGTRNNLFAITNAGGMVSSTGFATTGTINQPSAVAVDTAGSLWISNTGNNTVVEVVGVAAPITTPTVQQVINTTLGTRP